MELTVPPRLTVPRDCDEAARGRLALTDAVKILVVEDDQLIRAMVEEALSDGGFASTLTASGEEAITLLQAGRRIQIPGGRDRHQPAGKARWMEGRSLCPGDRSDDAHHLHDRHSRGGMGVRGRPKQPTACKALCPCSDRNRDIAAS